MSTTPRITKKDLNVPRDANIPQDTPPHVNPTASVNVHVESTTAEEELVSPKKRKVLLDEGGIWNTKQTVDPSNRDLYVKTILIELLIYLIFLTLLCILAFGMTSPLTYYFSKAMSTILIDTEFDESGRNFRKATQIADFWKFAEKVLIDSLYWDFWYNVKDMVATTGDEDNKILYENELLGLPRLRQLRVRNDSCQIHEDFRRMFTTCYDSYSVSAEDTNPFGPGKGTAWTYHSGSELGGSNHWGILTTYPPGGYYQDLNLERNVTIDMVENLKQNLWVNRGTRAVFLDLTVYNANVNLFCVIKLVMEFPPTGGVIPSWSFNVVKLIRYSTSFDYFVLVCEIVFVIFVIFYTVEEVYEMIVLKKKYLYTIWTYLDLIILLVAWVAIAFNIYRYIVVDKLLDTLLESTDKYSDFEFLGFWQTQFNNGIASLVFFAWIKVFKYMSFNKTMTQLSRTLSRCAKDVAGFSVMFFIVFFAFAQLGYLLFGSQVKDFSTLGNSIFSLLRIILGDFDFDALQNANRVLGPIFFFCYVFFIFFVLLNMFLAIINDTYAEVKSEIHARSEDFEVMKYLRKWYNKLRRKFGRPEVDVKDKVAEGKITHKEIKENLRKCNFSDLEIEMFFAKYDLSGDGFLTEEEVNRMTEDLYGSPMYQGEKFSTSDGLGANKTVPEVSQEAFYVLEERVLQVETSLEIVVDKIEKVVQLLRELDLK